VLVSDFHYQLPPELIAQQPLAERAASRLLHLLKTTGAVEDLQFQDLPRMLRAGDLVVFNNTRVFPARLYARRGGLKSRPASRPNPGTRDFEAGRIEVLLTEQRQSDPNDWECLVRPGRKVDIDDDLFFGEHGELQARVIARAEFGERLIRFSQAGDADFFEQIESLGHIPLPPYIHRDDSFRDRDRYQTVYARERGSVAAPTAGLHFTAEILGELAARGIETTEVTLHVGLGTFQPVRVERVEEHKIHAERYSISDPAAQKIERARGDRRRIVAIGTTTVRTLEFAALRAGGEICPGSGQADLFIYPGYQFQVVDALLTNFHLPESTLLMLVCALGGKANVLAAYRHAVSARYRFYSYGDCMLVE
jgi:S-adenosylmethionine:tRNA ribosyltransferase-isomerase